MSLVNFSSFLGFDEYLERLEERFAETRYVEWLVRNWTISVYVSVAYVAAIFAGRSFMSSRKPLDLGMALFAWNALMSSFSFLAAYRMFPFVAKEMREKGLVSVCGQVTDPIVGFWAGNYAFSKLLELGDTAFLVLRKKPLLFMHWYHHSFALVYAWFLGTDFSINCCLFVTLNASVHAIMYLYFAVKILWPDIPRRVAQIVTTIQITQMIAAFAITLYVAAVRFAGMPCAASRRTTAFSLFFIGSNFLLFSKMFYNNYLATNKRPASFRR